METRHRRAVLAVLVSAILSFIPTAEAKYIFDVDSRRGAPGEEVDVSGEFFGHSTRVMVSLVADLWRSDVRRWPTTVDPDVFHEVYPRQNLRGHRYVLTVARPGGRVGTFRASMRVPEVAPGRYGLELCSVPHFCQIVGRFTVLNAGPTTPPTEASGSPITPLGLAAAFALLAAARGRWLGNGSRFPAIRAESRRAALLTGPSSWR